MGNKKVILVVIFILLLVGIWSSNLLAADKKVYINGIDADYPPFTYIDEKGNPAGFDVECLNWIAQEMGFEVKHQPTAWDGIVSSLLAEKIDLVYSGMSITEERKQKVDFTESYWEINQALCVREDSDLNIIAALSGNYTVGSERGSMESVWLVDQLIKPGILGKDKLKLYESFSLAIKDLLNGRIDSAWMPDVTIKDAIRKGQPIKIVGIIKGTEYGVAVRKEDQELKALLNEGIAKLKRSPKWDELVAKYFTQ